MPFLPVGWASVGFRAAAASRRARAPSSQRWQIVGQLLAALPQRQRLLQRAAAGLQLLDHPGQLGPGLLVGQLVGSVMACDHPSRSSSPPASRTRRSSPDGDLGRIARAPRRRRAARSRTRAPAWPAGDRRAQPGQGVVQLAAGPVEPVAEAAAGPVAQRRRPASACGVEHRGRVGPAPAGSAIASRRCCSRSSRLTHRPVEPVPGLRDQATAPRPGRAPPAWPRRSGSTRARRRRSRPAACRSRARSRR